jgi:hypothetical protein
MKNIVLAIISLITGTICQSQQASPDTNFIVRINAVEWLPDGKQVLLSVVKFNKLSKECRHYRKCLYMINYKKALSFPIQRYQYCGIAKWKVCGIL